MSKYFIGGVDGRPEYDYGLLTQAEEGLPPYHLSFGGLLTFSDALHARRLLNVEEKPIKRIFKRLLAKGSPIESPLVRPPAPPPPDTQGADEAAAAYQLELKQFWEKHEQFKDDMLLDFAAFDSSIIRMQLLLTSNAKERERYAGEKVRIEATAQEVRESTTELRSQLEDAQRTLALRKTYDELAEKITSNRLLRSREDQHVNLEKLNSEIAELERESKEYAQTWSERREQFGRIIEEGMHLRRLIRDEKEEVERREGMEDREDVDEAEAGSLRGRSSGFATPRHDAGGATPLHLSMDEDTAGTTGLTVNHHLNARAKSPLRTSTPVPATGDTKPEETEDTSMAEDGEVSVELDATDDTREGEGAGSSGRATSPVDKMDTS
ncbi:hypothetical protein MMC26_001058 [Xylographa opegraphella]|nr:hypothetical protein [Xylographa opegraphella]